MINKYTIKKIKDTNGSNDFPKPIDTDGIKANMEAMKLLSELNLDENNLGMLGMKSEYGTEIDVPSVNGRVFPIDRESTKEKNRKHQEVIKSMNTVNESVNENTKTLKESDTNNDRVQKENRSRSYIALMISIIAMYPVLEYLSTKIVKYILSYRNLRY